MGLALLLFVGLFKFPDQVIGVMSGPFYLDSGYSKADIATVSKLYGVWMGIAGAFLGGIAVAAFGFRRMLFAGGHWCCTVQPGVPADGAVPVADLGVLRRHQRRQPVPGLRRRGAGGVHVRR